jgi:hypothetical protein
MAQTTLTLSIRLPYWWRLYIGSLLMMQSLGMLRIDTVTAAEFVVRHAVLKVNGKRI